MAELKEFRFPVSLEWPGGKHVVAHVEDKEAIEIATPPEFRGGFEGVWSPEDFLVAAAASCFMVTLVAVTQRQGIELVEMRVGAAGRVGRREDGAFGFTAIELRAELATVPEQVEALEAAARKAEAGCLVSASLALPVELELRIDAAETLTAA